MTRSFWQIKGETRSAPRADSEIPAKCDIAVIGGGLTGIATAYYLRMLGCQDVIVLEKDFVGFGASGKNAGFLLAGLSEPYSRLVVGMGPEWAIRLMKTTLENHDLIAEAIAANKIKCDYERSGSVHLASSDVERKEYDDTLELLNRDGFRADPIDKLPSRLSGFSGGYYFPQDGKLDPFAFVRGLSNGIQVAEGFEAVELRKTGVSVEIIGKGGRLKSEMAIIATNGYLPLLDGFFEGLIFPVRGQMMATFPLAKNVLGKAVFYANFGYDYFRQSVGNNIIIGGLRNRYLKEEIGFDDAINNPLQSDLSTYLNERLGVNDFRIMTRWSGLMGDTIDGLPIVGALPHNSSVIAAAGFNGHGFGLAMVVARDLAKAILKGERSDVLDRFSLRRFL
ncbi:MAG: FAD-binding oxidoreductase [Candidatus Zixiibacteriota bacterium]|nr:MAG: FAD-binding oxidoreductase [candidate division Zixibacteria bacterium]